MGAPKRIFAWLAFPTSHLVGTWSVTRYPSNAEHYILAAEHDRVVAEKDAEIARLQDAARPFSQPVIRNGIEVDLQVTVDQVFALRAALKGDDNECSGEGAPLWRTG